MKIHHIILSFATVLALFLRAPIAWADWLDLGRPLNRGGDIATFEQSISAASGRPHVIAGDCMSACTLWLGYRNACVTPDAVLWFHAAVDWGAVSMGGNPWRAISPAGNARLLGSYPKRVREVVRPWLDSPDYKTLTGAQLAALGVLLCRSRAR